jgi:hypothetical protein
MLGIERRSTRSYYVENPLSKRLWTCRKADCGIINDILICMSFTSRNYLLFSLLKYIPKFLTSDWFLQLNIFLWGTSPCPARFRLSQISEKGQLRNVCPHGTSRLQLYGCWYLSIFRKSVEKIRILLKSDMNASTLHTSLCAFMIITVLVLLRMRNVSEESCRENQNTYFMYNNIFSKSAPFRR